MQTGDMVQIFPQERRPGDPLREYYMRYAKVTNASSRTGLANLELATPPVEGLSGTHGLVFCLTGQHLENVPISALKPVSIYRPMNPA